MKKRPSLSPELTTAELEVMKVLWRKQPISAREVHDGLPKDQGWAYSTTRTILDRMARKELIRRQSFHGLWLFETAITRPRGLAGFIRRFADRVLEVPVPQVVSLFVENGRLSSEELRELETILEEEES